MKIKVLLSHILFVSLALGMVWLASFIPSWVLNAIAILAFVGSIFLALLLGLIYLKKKNVIVCLLAVLGFTCSVHARSIEDCDMIYAASIEEGNYCRYMVLTDMYESGICKYIKTFNPTKALSGDPEKELQEQVNNADKIVQGYSELDKAHQDYESGACRLLTAEEQEKSVDERRTILKANSSAICCAWALQTLNQIYTSQNGERKIETVPMMLSDKRNQCWPCDVVYLLITLANTLAYRSAPAMAAVAMMFLKWFFIFWIALKIGALFMNRDFARDKKGNPQPYDGKKFLKELLARSCWVGLAALILMDTAKQLDYDATKNTARSVGGRPTTMLDRAYQTVINPPFEMISAMGIKMTEVLVKGNKNNFYDEVAKAAANPVSESRVFSAAMLSTDYCKPKKCYRYTDTSGRVHDDYACLLGNNSMYQHLIKDKASSDGYKLDISSQGRAIGGSLTRNLLCLTQLAFQGLAPISAAGSIITTYSIQNAESLPFPLPGSIPIMPQVFYGLVLMLVCWLVGVAVAFRIIDIMVRVAMMVMLCPLFIALAVFPATRSKAATAVKFFASAVLGFVEISLAVGVTVPMFYYAIAGDKKDELIKAMVADSSTEYVPNLFAQFSANGLKFLLVIAGVAWMAFQLLEQVAVFFEKVFPLGGEGGLTVRNMASKGKMTEGMNSVRQFVGDHYDVVKKANVGKNLANSRIGQGVKKFANSVKSAGRKLYDGAKGSAAGRFAKKAGEATGKAIDKASKAIGSGMQKGGKSLMRSGAQVSKAGYGLGAIVGVPMMAAGAAAYAAGTTAKVMGKVGRFAARNAGRAARFAARNAKRAARAAGRFAKEQAKKGVYDFFHPEDKDS